jgi:hypothetical protein
MIAESTLPGSSLGVLQVASGTAHRCTDLNLCFSATYTSQLLFTISWRELSLHPHCIWAQHDFILFEVEHF